MGYSPWARKESDTTERLSHTDIHTYRKLGVSILEGKMVHAVDGKKQN